MTRLELVFADLKRDAWRLLGLAGAVALGVGVVLSALSLREGVVQLARVWIPASDRTLSVEAPEMSFGGMAARLDDDALAKLRSVPRVERVSPRMLLRVPAMSQVKGVFFGQAVDVATEVPIEGVGVEEMEPSISPGDSFAPQVGKPIPACLSTELLSLYNSTLAPSRGLPRLDATLVHGLELPVTVGRSTVTQSSGAFETVNVHVACVSPDAMLVGLSVPLSTVRSLNRRFGQDADTYSSALVIVRSGEDLPKVEQAIAEQGLRVDEGFRAIARRLGRVLKVGALAVFGLAGALLLLAAALIATMFHGVLYARAAELSLLRALGATERFLFLLVAFEAFAVGCCGGVVGVFASSAVMWWGNAVVAGSLGATVFVVGGGATAMAFALGLAASQAGALAAVWLVRRT